MVVVSIAERLHMLSDLEEKYAIELDREYRGYGNEVVRDLPPMGMLPFPASAKTTDFNFFWV